MLSVGRLTYHSGDKHGAMLAGNKLHVSSAITFGAGVFIY
jgi:hypothetical protein